MSWITYRRRRSRLVLWYYHAMCLGTGEYHEKPQEGSGQLHVPAALSEGKQPPVSIEYKVGWAPEPVCTFWDQENYLPLPGFEPRIVPEFSSRKHLQIWHLRKTTVATRQKRYDLLTFPKLSSSEQIFASIKILIITLDIYSEMHVVCVHFSVHRQESNSTITWQSLFWFLRSSSWSPHSHQPLIFFIGV